MPSRSPRELFSALEKMMRDSYDESSNGRARRLSVRPAAFAEHLYVLSLPTDSLAAISCAVPQAVGGGRRCRARTSSFHQPACRPSPPPTSSVAPSSAPLPRSLCVHRSPVCQPHTPPPVPSREPIPTENGSAVAFTACHSRRAFFRPPVPLVPRNAVGAWRCRRRDALRNVLRPPSHRGAPPPAPARAPSCV